MSVRDDLQKHLTPELFAQVVDALGDDFIYDQVPRSRLNRVIQQRDEARTENETLKLQLAGGTQSTATSKPTTQPATPATQTVNIEELKEQLSQQFKTEQEQAIKDVKIQYAGLDKLRQAGALDAELVWSLIDKSKVTLDDKGTLTGLDEQIPGLKEAKSFLFGETNPVPAGTGKQGGSADPAQVVTKDAFSKMTTEEQLKFKESHPEQFKQFLMTM